MKKFIKKMIPHAVALGLFGAAGVIQAAVNVQCPGDLNGDGDYTDVEIGETPPAGDVKCMHLIAGDGFANMSDGNPLYIFGYADITGTAPENAIADGILAADWPGPTIVLDEGQEFYLSLTNVGTVIRPDLFDAHTVHFHGFPNASAAFDGVPEVSISVNMGASLSYYYNIVEPGTYLYHCHVEATEHMEMGMLANLYVHAGQDERGYDVNRDGTIDAGELAATQGTRKGGAPGNPMGYAYNDGDGTTAFDREQALQISSFDSRFHDASLFVQPLPFAALEGDYPQINGRGYPDTVKANDGMGPPVDNTTAVDGHAPGKVTGIPGEILNNGDLSQEIGSLVEVTQGENLLLRLSNVGLDRFYTLTAPGLTMKVVGTGARQMRGITGKNLYRETASVNFGGGETNDVMIDTTDIAPGTYFLHAAEFHQMSNLTQMDGGMMTEIVVKAPTL
ncbi:MAG: multicopper oxidase domain-containing protein [Candidatus Sedimenticola sp. 20ELBAFRAG]